MNILYKRIIEKVVYPYKEMTKEEVIMQYDILKKPRFDIIDAMKGYAIILVIMGHIIVFIDPLSYTKNRLFTFIYSFHMPLMLFLSGYLVHFSSITSNFRFIYKKFMVLVVPYLTWNFIGFFIVNNFVINRKLITDIMNRFIIYDNLWFLPVLFISFVIVLLYIIFEREMTKINLEKYATIIFVVIFELIIWSIPPVFQGIYSLRWFPAFVFIGYLFAMYKDKFLNKEFLYQMSVLIFILLLPFWSVTVINLTETDAIKLTINFILAITGMIVTYKLVKSLKNTKLYNFFVFCGAFSLELYIVSNFLALIASLFKVHLWLGNGIIAILSGTAIYVILSIVIVLILSYNKNISIILFCRRSLKKSIPLNINMFGQ